MSRQGQTIMYARGSRRRKLLDVDLNDPPPCEHNEPVPPTIVNVIEDPMPSVQEDNLPTAPVAPVRQDFQPLGSTPPVPINVEELDDDDVIISTPTAFEEARNSSRRLQARISVVNVESVGASPIPGPNRRTHRKRYRPMHFVINLEGSSSSMKQPVAPTPPPPPPPPPTFKCPVCMGPLVEEVTTKCGHIFCKACIKTAIAAVPKCPTCRRKVTNRDIIRIYLPAAS